MWGGGDQKTKNNTTHPSSSCAGAIQGGTCCVKKSARTNLLESSWQQHLGVCQGSRLGCGTLVKESWSISQGALELGWMQCCSKWTEKSGLSHTCMDPVTDIGCSQGSCHGTSSLQPRWRFYSAMPSTVLSPLPSSDVYVQALVFAISGLASWL